MKGINNISYNNNQNNQTYIQTNKDDLKSLEVLEKNNMNMIPGYENNNENNELNDYNKYFNNNFNFFSPFNMGNMYMFGGQNTFFDKLFMTLERAHYQIFHLLEMIKLIKNQKPTIIFFKSLLISAFKAIKQKYYEIILNIKEYLLNLKNIFSFQNDKYNEEDLKNHIKVIDYVIKILLSLLLLIITFQII